MKLFGFLMIFFVLAGAAFAQDTEKETSKKVYKAVTDPDGVQRVDVLSGEYFFDPNYIIVKVNVPVELKIKKEQSIVPHDVIINAPEAGIEIKESLSSDPKVIKFTPKKVGKYPFYCDKRFLFFKTHRAKGMEGTLEVTE